MTLGSRGSQQWWTRGTSAAQGDDDSESLSGSWQCPPCARFIPIHTDVDSPSYSWMKSKDWGGTSCFQICSVPVMQRTRQNKGSRCIDLLLSAYLHNRPLLKSTRHQHVAMPGRTAQRWNAQHMAPSDKMSSTRLRERLVPYFSVVLSLRLIEQETAPAT